MSDAAADIKVRLIVDVNSNEIVSDMRRDMNNVSNIVKKTSGEMSHSMAGGFKAGAMAVGMIYAELANKALEYGKEMFTAPIEAFRESAAQVKQLAGTFAMLDSSGASLERIHQAASDTKDELEKFGIAAGIADTELVEVFDNVIDRGGKTIEQAQKLTEEMGYAGRAIPGGARELSESFRNIEQGIIRAKNPIVGMIAATHMLKGNAKQVAAQMMAMPIVKQMEIAEKAVTKMGEKMKDAPLGFNQIMTSMKVLGGNLLETMGEPMMKGLTKAAEHVRGMFVDSKGENTELTDKLVRAADYFGTFLAQTFEAGSQFVDGFMVGVTFASDEVSIIWREVFGESDKTWKNMLEYSKMAGMVLGGFVKMFAAGVGALIVAAEKTIKYMAITAGFLLKGFGDVVGAPATSAAGAKVMAAGFAPEQADLVAKMGKSNGGNADDIRTQYLDNLERMGAKDTAGPMAELMAAQNQRAQVEKDVNAARAAAMQGDAVTYYAMYADAAKIHDEAAMKNIASFMGNNRDMAAAMSMLGPEVLEGGMKQFIESLRDAGNKDMAKLMGSLAKPDVAIGNGAVLNQTFTGAITVKQDFRDSDPDRVIVAMKRELGKAGSDRLQARTAGPFGF